MKKDSEFITFVSKDGGIMDYLVCMVWKNCNNEIMVEDILKEGF